MTTASTLVRDAMSGCGALGRGDALSADDAQLVLRRLTRMLDSWSNVRSMVYEVFSDSFPTVAGTASYSSTLLTTMLRAVRVDSIVLTRSGTDYPVDPTITLAEYQAIPDKASRGTPSVCYVQTGAAALTFNFFPVPEAIYTATVYAPRPLPSTDLEMTTDLVFPRGYEKAVVDCLTVDIAPTFRRPVTREMDDNAKLARAALAATNYRPDVMSYGFAAPSESPLQRFYRG